MKKLLLILIVVSSSFLYGEFGLSITQMGDLTLGNLAPGETEYAGGDYDYSQPTIITIDVETAPVNDDWTLYVQSDGFSGPAALGIDNLEWEIAYAHTGINSSPWVQTMPSAYQRTKFDATNLHPNPLNSSNQVYYRGNAGDRGQFQFNFNWHITIPDNQRAGSYSTRVWFTLIQ